MPTESFYIERENLWFCKNFGNPPHSVHEPNAKYRRLKCKLLFSSHTDVFCVFGVQGGDPTTITNGRVDLLGALMLSMTGRFRCSLVSPAFACLYTLPWLNARADLEGAQIWFFLLQLCIMRLNILGHTAMSAYAMIIWRCHQMGTFSALLALYARNSPVTGEFPSQRQVTRSFDVFCDLCLNKRLSKQLWGWWFETHRAHYDATVK